jgi:hypothetical protein
VGRSIFLRTVAAIAAIGAICMAVPSLAAASSSRAPNRRVHYGVSANWSGYVVSGFGRYTSVTASWTVPELNCAATPNAFSAFWAGLDGNTSNTVEQTGTEANCYRGAPSYAAWFEMFPKKPVTYPDPVFAGDSFNASVSAFGKGRFRLTLTDTTRGWTRSIVQKRRSAKLASAEVIAEAPSTHRAVLPLADFELIKFTSASANGSALTASTPGIEPLTMDDEGTEDAAPSGITGGGAFSVAWKHE